MTDTADTGTPPAAPEGAELPLAGSGSGHSCGCGCEDTGLPELDARTIPHAIRHGAILGALRQVPPGAAMVLVAPHNPLPLLAQIEELEGGAIDVAYLEEGPEAWRLKLTRAR